MKGLFNDVNNSLDSQQLKVAHTHEVKANLYTDVY